MRTCLAQLSQQRLRKCRASNITASQPHFDLMTENDQMKPGPTLVGRFGLYPHCLVVSISNAERVVPVRVVDRAIPCLARSLRNS
jgi:hypothetical protein